MMPRRAVTRSMTHTGAAELTEALPPRSRQVQELDEFFSTLAWTSGSIQPLANRDIMERVEDSMRREFGGQRQATGSKAGSVLTHSSHKSKRSQLEKEEQLAHLRKQKRHATLKRMQAETFEADLEEQYRLAEMRSQLSSEEEEQEVFDEARSQVEPLSIHTWMENSVPDDENFPETSRHPPPVSRVNSQHSIIPPIQPPVPKPRSRVPSVSNAQTQQTMPVARETTTCQPPVSTAQTQPKMHVARDTTAVQPPVTMEQVTDAFTRTLTEAVKAVQPSQSSGIDGFIARQCGGARDLPDFHGEPENWIPFIQRYDSSTKLCRFSNEENLIRLQKCLKGKARESVNAMLSTGCHPEEVIAILEKRFGRPELVFQKMMEKVKYAQTPAEGDFNGIVELFTLVKNLCATAKVLKLQSYLTNPQLIMELKRKLPSSLQLTWGIYMAKLKRIADIEDFANFLDELADGAVLVCESVPVKKKQNNGHKETNLTITERSGCVLACKDKHYLSKCPKFLKMSPEERWESVKKSNCCFSCLARNHRTVDCKRKKKCGIDGCTRKHSALLHGAHLKRNDGEQPVEVPVNEENQRDPNFQGIIGRSPKSIGNVFLKILPEEINGVRANALLDDGSTITLLDADFAARLGLRGRGQRLDLSWQGGLDDSDPDSISVAVKIKGIDEDTEYLLTDVRTKKNLGLPMQRLSDYKFLKKWKHLDNVPFPDVISERPVIDIGEDNIALSLSRKLVEGPRNTPVASWTCLGWVVHGPCGRPTGPKFPQLTLFCTNNLDPDQALHELVKEQFRLESLGIVNCPNIPMSAMNKRADEMMEKLSFKDGDRWTAPMLWKTDDLKLPNNWPAARKRLQIQEREMDKDEELASMYCKKIEEYLQKGFCHKLSPEELNQNSDRIWYLPHFGNKNPNKPGKLRLVFDAAARYEGTSLNDALIQGRDLMSPLINVLMKFRHYEIAFSGDIRDMFHMVNIRQEDLPSLRFLWRGRDRTSRPDVYQMDVMVFGAVSSPYQAQWIKNRNASDYAAEYPEAVDAIHNRHYVDDYLDSCSTPEKAIKKIMEVRDIHRRGGFEIRGWNCNVVDVLKVVAPGEQVPESISLSDEKLERVLGLHWKPKEDVFTFKTSFHKVDPAIITGEKVPTKRQLLQLVMSMFDPLGFLGHLTARGRMLLQHVWKSGIGWDEKLIGIAASKWSQFLSQVMQISQVRIKRCFAPRISDGTNFQVHTFCDASQQAFGAVTYLRVVGTDGSVSVNIVMSKTRVTPIKSVSIPRLELEAALVGARQTSYFRSMFEIKIDGFTLWTDSRNVIYWLRAEDPSRFKMYVAHRIGEILDLTDVSMWKWVPTAMNVADDCTRDACDADVTPTSRWFVGPEFLMQNEDAWPKEPDNGRNPDKTDLEEKAVCMIHTVADRGFKVEDFSCYMRLVRVTSWWLRYMNNLRRRPENREKCEYLTVPELREAELWWIRKVQFECFADEMDCLIGKRKVDRHSKLANLCPILVDGVIRLDIRIVNSPAIPATAKAPIILDRNHPWTILLVKWFHKLHGHLGHEKICNELRQSYWIIGMKSLVKKISTDCQECKMRRAKPIYPKMAALPEIRVTRPSRPFSFTGVDYFGPLDILHGRKHEKRYGVLFTCLSTRAVHLEVAHSLSTDDFLLALERFISTRGEPMELKSDNGTNFKGAEKELRKCLEDVDHLKIADALANRGIAWKFIPPSAPHMGGAWERLVQSVKAAMNIVLKNRTLTDAVLSSVLAQAMAMVNNRPITAVSGDWKDVEAITPNSFLIGTSSIKQPPGVFDDSDLCTRKRWRMARVLSQHFWKRWTKEYLTSLAMRTKWRKDTPDVKVGELVFVPDSNELTQSWRKGLVVAAYPGKDGYVRVVDIKTANGLIKRPVVKLLRMQDSEKTGSGDSNQLSHGGGYVPEENGL